MTEHGAGAWMTPKFYGRGINMPDPKNKYQTQRVRWGIIAVQKELVRQGFLAKPAKYDGGVGPKTDAAIRAFQKSVDLKQDGKLTSKGAGRLFYQQFAWWQITLGIPDNLLLGVCRLESAFDPAAEGYVDPRDRGIGQFNRDYHPDITDEVAFSDPAFCIARTADMLIRAHERFKQGVGNPWDCAVASHNSPKLADQWSRDGKPPTSQIERYVSLVQASSKSPL